MDDERWSQLCQLACILARFEQVFRAGASTLRHLAGPLVEHSNNIGKLATALVNPPTLEDLSALGRATVEDLAATIRGADELFIGPTFAQSRALGGADADLIYDGTLVDLKSSSLVSVVGRAELWQLLGYLLADTEDAYHVERVGFAALRRRRTVLWTAQELIDALAGRPSPPSEYWRQDFVRLFRAIGPRSKPPIVSCDYASEPTGRRASRPQAKSERDTADALPRREVFVCVDRCHRPCLGVRPRSLIAVAPPNHLATCKTDRASGRCLRSLHGSSKGKQSPGLGSVAPGWLGWSVRRRSWLGAAAYQHACAGAYRALAAGIVAGAVASMSARDKQTRGIRDSDAE